ncbi:MAG: argininosuccinate lyase [Planctomycetota bacterium]|nr:argininosuccinate lyase [Planctomycetota bacterium]
MSDDKMWGARFEGELEERFAQFQDSLRFDAALAFADLDTNLAWSEALCDAGVLSEEEFGRVAAAIDELGAAWHRDGLPSSDAEDVHSLVEQQLVRTLGELGKRIHTGRSRNDQVATDMRLHVREWCGVLIESLEGLCMALVEKAAAHSDDPMPGYTHLQRAQPVTIGHHCLAYVEMFSRGRDRLGEALQRFDQCPLGSGALAGTAFPVDREAIAAHLEFQRGATRNSLDATASRDYLCEVAFACAMMTSDLSRLAEDYVFFASHEAGLLRFGDAVSTGSSLMPQKRNPDAMELIRGKAALVQGALQSMLSLMKSQPLGYNRDLQHDKEILLPALEATNQCLLVAATAVEQATFDVPRCAAEAARGYLNATDLADLLVARGVAFRDAHAMAGAAVNRAVELGVELQELPGEVQRELLPQLDADLAETLSVAAVLARRDVIGGTAPARVRAEVKRWRIQIAEWAEGYHELEDLTLAEDLDDEPPPDLGPPR